MQGLWDLSSVLRETERQRGGQRERTDTVPGEATTAAVVRAALASRHPLQHSTQSQSRAIEPQEREMQVKESGEDVTRCGVFGVAEWIGGQHLVHNHIRLGVYKHTPDNDNEEDDLPQAFICL
jgi:hypothetical protein